MRHLQRRSTLLLSWPMAIGLLALLLTAACSKDKNVDQPAKLTPLPHPSLRVQHVWSHSVGDKKAVALRLSLGASIADDRVYAAGHHGDVVALDLNTGHVVWRTKVKAPLSGGTAAGFGLVLVGSSDGRLFAFDAASGKSRWNVRLNGEVLAPAAISPKLIVVRTVDGKLRALSPEDGHELWTQEQQVPRLSLRGTASPVIVGDLVLCGFDNGKVVAVSAADGGVQWETTVTPPHGRTELERLVDIDSPVEVAGRDVYAVGFQGKVAMLALDTGQVWWSHDASSYRGLTRGDDSLYISEADGEIVVLKARTGAEVWRQNALLHRALSPLAVTDDSVIAGDFQGYVHWVDRATGALAARVSSGKVRISTAPLVAGNLVVVINDRGQISAWRVTPIAGAVATVRKPVPPSQAPPPPPPENK
ncbi:MAG TPA: outer membrane protein assembly factor BamB [Steroidobacteraceae bacterium]|nr:outer membrane protein assembly factor BamB [Steroidobacteraceae bacterium]